MIVILLMFNEDAFEESEYVIDMLGENEYTNNTVKNEGRMPSNDFCFTQDDFIETIQQMNDTVRHQWTYYMDAWLKINALQNHVVEVKSSKSGKLK